MAVSQGNAFPNDGMKVITCDLHLMGMWTGNLSSFHHVKGRMIPPQALSQTEVSIRQ
jgi:hypothetical protein